MKRAPLYSSTNTARQARARQTVTPPRPVEPRVAPSDPRPASGAPSPGPGSASRRVPVRLSAWARRYERWIMLVAGVALALAAVLGRDLLRSEAPALVQEDIDAAVMHTLLEKTLPSPQARAADAVRQSVVRVTSLRAQSADSQKGGRSKAAGQAPQTDVETGVGSGVVIVEDGTILTNLHVVLGAERIRVTFHDGSESEADLIAAQPENDLAVIKARTLPDDLPAATLGTSAGLKPGDEVVAVGFPFGIGPSVSAGVVSGVDREFRSGDGKRRLTRLIQFDAAANPGNSGGPLVTMSGEVVGIVTAILNPTEARTFIGIGFAATIESAGGGVGIPPF